jgi:stage II sporulation protein AA (anti-sigma F factor antagonist)
MRLDIRKKGDTVTVTIVGQVDTEGGRELSESFVSVTEDPAVRHGVFDLSEVPAISSAGIGKLLRFYKHFDKLGGTMKIKGISAPLKQQFLEIRLDQIIPIEG